MNDIHAQDSIFRLLLEGVGKAKPDFVCFNGDMLSSMESEKQLFEGYLNSAAELLTPAGIPIFATRGNHENRGSFSPRFLDYFPTSTGEVYYTFRQGRPISSCWTAARTSPTATSATTGCRLPTPTANRKPAG